VDTPKARLLGIANSLLVYVHAVPPINH